MKQKLLQAAAILFCTIVALKFVLDLEGTEFGGGRVTSHLLDLSEDGSDLLLAAIPLTFLRRRTAAAMASLGCLLCLPLYLFFIAPGPYRWLVPGPEWSFRVASFVWDWWAIAGVMSLALAAYVFILAIHNERAVSVTRSTS